ncbi:MAG: DNA-directed RNA polymerase subunit beta' [Coriobacteriales bacterium]|nr:DNA-directed RNA polymerase subunit beta' [Coriobacteriales bacterium]
MGEFDVNNFDYMSIKLASADDIRSWSHGEVKKPETINYRTLKPEKEGLFCQKIFGPIKDWECECGKYKRIRFKGVVCERCGVEVTKSEVRRERMGHIELACPVSHIWYFKGTPSRLGYLLDLSVKDLEKVLYYASAIITSVNSEAIDQDKEELKEELQADFEDMDAELAHAIEATERLSTTAIDDAEFGEDEDAEERMTPEQVAAEIDDLKDEFAERKLLREDALNELFKLKTMQLVPDESLYREMMLYYSQYFSGGMGAEAVRDLLSDLDLVKMDDELRETIKTSKGQKHQKAVKRLKVVEAFLKSGQRPTDMILDVIPVLPPDLRPMVQLDGGRFATSDLNDLYRRVINRNNRLKRLLEVGAPDIIVNNEKRMLQEAVDSLFDNGRRGRPVNGSGDRPLKSLSDMLKGKQGRFRQNLLGKRVDYSGRSVICVGPNLKLHQCGFPKLMALELFKPFVIKRLVELELAQNAKQARKMVDKADNDEVWDVLEEVIKEHPVLLNRAPTLHRLGIQAFEPVLIEGKAIRLHPLVCTAFNADFDGDQMAVHVPLSNEAQAEARVLMLSSNNIKSPAHGKPLTVPTQDMVIGMYYLTTARDGFPGEGHVFINFADALNAYDADRNNELKPDVDLQAKIWARLQYDTAIANGRGDNGRYTVEEHKAGERIETTVGRILFNSVLPADHEFINYPLKKSEIAYLVEDCANRYGTTQMEEILDGIKSIGYHYATRAGISVSIFDASIPPTKEALLEDADKEAAEVEDQYEMGLISEAERHRSLIDVWTAANDKVGDAMAAGFDKFNPIYMMADSGARGNIKQIRQLAGMRGLMSDPKGEIIDRPIKANFREGLSVLEYFISTHGARKGLADTALKTAQAGYLTRKLVDVAQDQIIREVDCGSEDGIDFDIVMPNGSVQHNLVGRCLLEPVVDPKTGEVLLDAGEYISSDDQLEAWAKQGVVSVKTRTIMTCHAAHGVCQKCYGWDLATAKPVNIGATVGIIAAQSVGEPGTQLTLRTFHAGGVAGEDITHGLPRVIELFEAREPKGKAEIAELDGTLQIHDEADGRTLSIHNQAGEEWVSEKFSAARGLMPGISDNIEVRKGQQLTKGSIDLKQLLRLTDPYTTLRYIVEQVQDVYVSQGVEINDKHIEVIAKQMLRRVTVLDGGDSEYLPGSQVDAFEFSQEQKRIEEAGGTAPIGQTLLLGITKASLATDSFLSAASFQETTKVLTDAAIEGKIDHLMGLKENVILGKKIPAGTSLNSYKNVELTYHGQPLVEEKDSTEFLPAWAPQQLREVEDMLPKPETWIYDSEIYHNLPPELIKYLETVGYGDEKPPIPLEEAKLYLFDDLGVSQRWSNKFSEVNIETVGDLIGHSLDDLREIDGIGAKAIEELMSGLKSRNLEYVLEPERFADFIAKRDGIAAQQLEAIAAPELELSPSAPAAFAEGGASFGGADDDLADILSAVPESFSADPDEG